MNDFRLGFRSLARSPAYSLIAVATFALGIASTSAMFSVVDALLNKPVDVPGLQRLVMVQEMRPGETRDWTSVSAANLADWRESARSFDRMIPIRMADVNLTGGGEPEKVIAARVGSGFFETLGAPPELGGALLAGDTHQVVLSRRLFERRFQGDPSAIGAEIPINGEKHRIAGVMSRDFRFPPSAELWIPLELTPKDAAQRDLRLFSVLARLKAGTGIGDARQEMNSIAGRLSDAHPESNRDWGVRVLTLPEFVNSDYTREYSRLSLYSVLLVLMIACANVANLQFARSAARARELALRSALGASRWRLMRQLLAESVVLSAAGAAAGLLLSFWFVDLIVRAMPADIEKFVGGWHRIGLDGRVAMFTLALALLSGLAAGIAPAFGSSRPDLNDSLKEGGRGFLGGGARRKLRSFLLATEIALSVVLLAGAGLMIRGMQSLVSRLDMYHPDRVLTLSFDLSATRYPNPLEQAAVKQKFLTEAGAIPGVTSAAVSTMIPYNLDVYYTAVLPEGRVEEPGGGLVALKQSVSPGYFLTLRAPMREGRELRDSDRRDAPLVAVINEAAAREWWPGQSAIGRSVRLERGGAPYRVVGVVADLPYIWTARQPEAAVYVSLAQNTSRFGVLSLRVSGDPAAFAPAVRARLAAVDPEQPFYYVKSWSKAIADAVSGLTYVTALLTVMGFMALAMSAAGIYGLMSQSITERRPEIGVRMVLGARVHNVLGLMMSRALILACAGLGVGLALALLLARAISGLIFGVTPLDFWTYALVCLVLLLTAAAASGIPAWRASRIDPLEAIRR
ncbi:MAG: ABC transporter permease [Bryobacteraceae bacterium]|nr:ABC transporter permease [Bryobacteraceae bacterium]